MYGEEIVDMEHQHFTESLDEAIDYAIEQCIFTETIHSTVYDTTNSDQLFFCQPPIVSTNSSQQQLPPIVTNNSYQPARITRTSIFSNRTRTLEIPQYTPEEFERRLYAYNKGNIDIDDAFPLLSPMAKLFIEKGITPEEWDDD
jgi:hypothetical protein